MALPGCGGTQQVVPLHAMDPLPTGQELSPVLGQDTTKPIPDHPEGLCLGSTPGTKFAIWGKFPAKSRNYTR